MAAHAMKMPTLVNGESVPGGHCYVLTLEGKLNAAELISLKVSGEFRKWRAGGDSTTCVHALIGVTDRRWGKTPLDEQLATQAVQQRFLRGDIEVIVDGVSLKGFEHHVPVAGIKEVVFKVKSGA